MRVGNIASVMLILNTGVPQGCVLSPLLYSLFTHNCVVTHDSYTIIKFADDMTVVGDNLTAYREVVSDLAGGGAGTTTSPSTSVIPKG
jgi:hypothetical protein